MWRFVAIFVLAVVGMVWCLFFGGYVGRCAFVPGFGAAVVLPAVMNPTRHWARGFFLCFDIVYAASCVGAYLGGVCDARPADGGLYRERHPRAPVRDHGVARGRPVVAR